MKCNTLKAKQHLFCAVAVLLLFCGYCIGVQLMVDAELRWLVQEDEPDHMKSGPAIAVVIVGFMLIAWACGHFASFAVEN